MKSRLLSLVAVFAAISVVFDSLAGLPELSGVWYSWIFIVEPINGIALGPCAGFLSSLIGVMIGHSIYFRDPYEFLFTFGAPIGAMISGLLFRGAWKPVFIYYNVLLAAYFITPVAWQLPIWGMWDIYFAYFALLGVAILLRNERSQLDSKQMLVVLAICSFVGLEADVLFRIFLFIPCQTYRLFYDYSIETLRFIWVEGAAETPIKAAMSTIFTVIVGPPLVKIIRKK